MGKVYHILLLDSRHPLFYSYLPEQADTNTVRKIRDLAGLLSAM